MLENRILYLQSVILQSALLLQRFDNEPDKITKNLTQIFESLNPYLDSNFVRAIFIYTKKTTEKAKETLKNLIQEFPKTLNNTVMST